MGNFSSWKQRFKGSQFFENFVASAPSRALGNFCGHSFREDICFRLSAFIDLPLPENVHRERLNSAIVPNEAQNTPQFFG